LCFNCIVIETYSIHFYVWFFFTQHKVLRFVHIGVHTVFYSFKSLSSICCEYIQFAYSFSCWWTHGCFHWLFFNSVIFFKLFLTRWREKWKVEARLLSQPEETSTYSS
jgi:hypothetical protein